MRGTTASLFALFAGCGESPAAPDFSLACAAVEGEAGCGSARCVLNPLDGFRGRVILSSTEGLGLRTHGLPAFVEVEDAPVELLLGFSAQTSDGATGQVELTALHGKTVHDVTLDLSLHAVAPPAAAGNMVLYGCAGLAGIVVGPALDAVYVGAWRNGFTVDFCSQTLSGEDGTYQLTVPASCGLAPTETVYTTAGGVEACTLPFQPGAVRYFDVILTTLCD